VLAEKKNKNEEYSVVIKKIDIFPVFIRKTCQLISNPIIKEYICLQSCLTDIIYCFPPDMLISVYIYIFSYYVDHIYPNELVIKDTTNTDRSASYLDLHLEIDSEGRFTMKRDNFNLPNVKCPLICSLIPAACGVYLSQ
jgi:hypothetical protein